MSTENRVEKITFDESHLVRRIDRLERIVAEIPFEEIEGEAGDVLSLWMLGVVFGFCLYALLVKKGVIT